MKTFEKLKKEVIAKSKAKLPKGQRRDLFIFKKEHYKKNMSSKQGFGSEDLKPTYNALYKFMMSKYDIKIDVTRIAEQELTIFIK